MSWLTDAEIKALWAEAVNLDPAVLTLLLDSAYEDCVAFLPCLPEGEDYADVDMDTPSRKLAQAFQVKSRYLAMLAGRDGNIGVEGNSFIPFPLDWSVRQLLRPKTGTPVLG